MQDYILYLKVLCCVYLHICLVPCAIAQTTGNVSEIVSMTGEVEVFHQNIWQQAEVRQLLYQGDHVRTGENGFAKILANDGSRIHVNQNSLFILKEVAESAGWVQAKFTQIKRSLYQLSPWKSDKSGEISLENDNPNIEIYIETPTIKAGIRGTALVLSVKPEPVRSHLSLPTSVLMVTDGLVEVKALTGPMDSVAVATGYQVVAEQNKALKLEKMVLTPLDAVQWTLYIPPMSSMKEPLSPRTPPELSAGLNVAYEAFQGGQFSKANHQLNMLIRQYPKESAPYRLLALTLLATNQKEDAHKAAMEAVEKNPASTAAAIVLSYTFQALFDLPNAKKWILKALELDPKNQIALANLGRLQFGEGNIEDAWKTAQSLKSSAPAVDTDAEVENLLGFILLAQRKTEDAAKHFIQATILNSRLAEPHLGHALAQMRSGNTENAFKEMAKAVLLEPQRAVFYSYWGKMLFQVGHFAKALNAFDRAQTLDPNDPTSEYYKAILLRDLNRPGEAIQAFKNAVALNDNRAVYRSRFLLDQDLALRNTKLSNLYSELGLDAWARNKALASVKYDYTNFDSHLFYAGSLSQAEDRSYSFTSEALLARLLQPANVNTFNNFNNYTAQFEQPKVEGTITGLAGNNSTYGGSGELYGALPAANAAFGLGGFYQDSDRWRDSNFENLRSAVALGKWQPTLNDGFFAGVTQTKIKQGDAIYPRFEYDSPAQPDNRFEGNVQRYELGYHRHLAPKSDLLLYVTYLESDTDIFQKEQLKTLNGMPIPTELKVDAEQTIDAERPFWQGQLHYTFNAGPHQLMLGTLQYNGESQARNTLEYFLNGDDQRLSDLNSDQQNERDIEYASYYLQDIWQINKWLFVEIAGYYDHMKNANVFNGTEWTVEDFDPRLGFIVTPTGQDTFRLAAFRYILPFIAPRLDPTDIAGIPVFRNSQEGSQNTEYAFAWDHEWENGFSSINIFYLKKDYTDKILDDGQEISRETNGKTKGIEVEHNQLLTKRIGSFARYRYLDIDDDLDTLQEGMLSNVNRREHLFNLGLKYVHPDGYFAGGTQTLRYIDNHNSRTDETAAITDFEIGYQFPEKRGEVSFKVLNLFDEHYNWITDRLVVEGRQPARQISLSLSLNF